MVCEARKEVVIGVLALQGAFLEHVNRLAALGVRTIELRNKADLLKPFDGLILPGGESTVIGKLLKDLDMLETLRDRINQGLPVFGTCAGMILLAKTIANSTEQHLATMDIAVLRNAYGRQLGSFNTVSTFGDVGHVPMTFIRAPYIESVSQSVQVMSTVNGHIVAAQQGNQLVTSFHSELTDDPSIHRYFLKIVNLHR
jgi:5'-phosphate synthase pdxT subunit